MWFGLRDKIKKLRMYKCNCNLLWTSFLVPNGKILKVIEGIKRFKMVDK